MPKLSKNDAMLFLPEDLPQGPEYPCCGLVVGIKAGLATVYLDIPDESETPRAHSVARDLAESYKVTKRKFKDHRRGLLLRRGVFSPYVAPSSTVKW